MKDLLRLEFRKLRRQKSFYVILVLMIAALLISGITYKIIADFIVQNDIGNVQEALNNTGEVLPFNLSDFLLTFVSASNFSLLTAIFVSILVCGDYESQIIKNVFSRGYSRTDFYFAKLIYAFVLTTVMFVCTMLFSVVLGGVLFGFQGLSDRAFMLIGGQYLACMSFVAMYFTVATAMKKLGGTLAINIIVPTIIPLLLGLIDTVIESTISTKIFKVSEIWNASFLQSLTNINVDQNRLIFCFVGSAVYIAVFVFLGYTASKNTEI